MEGLEFIGNIIMSIGVLVLFAYLFGLLFGWISKSTNSRISYHGKTIYTPKDHDENMKNISETKDKIVANAKLLIENIKNLSEKKMNTGEKIKALKELEELKNAGIITNEQYESLKSKLL